MQSLKCCPVFDNTIGWLKMKQYKFGISSADKAPFTAPILLCGDICDNLIKAKHLGYDAIEVHTRNDVSWNIKDILDVSTRYDVAISMLITGRLATEQNLSLISDDQSVCERAIMGLKDYVDLAQSVNSSGIVVGWARGNIPDTNEKDYYLQMLAENLKQVCIYAMKKNIAVCIEIINRYEINTLNTTSDGIYLIERYDIPNLFLHLDTFHMNIEESDMISTLRLSAPYLGYLHLASNTRSFPTSGQIDFGKILRTLEDINYKGYATVECIPQISRLETAMSALGYLKSLN